LAPEDPKDYLAPQEPLVPKGLQEHKEFQEGRDRLEHLDKLVLLEEVSQMVIFAEFAREFLTTKWRSLFMSYEDRKVYLVKALLDRQESQEKQDHQDLLDLPAGEEREASWDCQDTKDHKDCKDQEESPESRDPKDQPELACLELQEFLDLRASKDHEEKAKSELTDSKGRQDLEVTLAFAAKMVPLGLWVLASNVLQ